MVEAMELAKATKKGLVGVGAFNLALGWFYLVFAVDSVVFLATAPDSRELPGELVSFPDSAIRLGALVALPTAITLAIAGALVVIGAGARLRLARAGLLAGSTASAGAFALAWNVHANGAEDAARVGYGLAAAATLLLNGLPAALWWAQLRAREPVVES